MAKNHMTLEEKRAWLLEKFGDIAMFTLEDGRRTASIPTIMVQTPDVPGASFIVGCGASEDDCVSDLFDKVTQLREGIHKITMRLPAVQQPVLMVR